MFRYSLVTARMLKTSRANALTIKDLSWDLELTQTLRQ
jgi:hypothetical protein